MRFLSVCSGIEAASVAWQPLGWKAVAFSAPDSGPQGKEWLDDGAGYCQDSRPTAQAIAFGWQNSASQGDSVSEHVSPSLDKSKTPGVMQAMQVRRLTPLETERLMGFPDGYTAIRHKGKPAADGPRYKSHGNSWAINCPRWIGERIEAVEAITSQMQHMEAA